MSYDAEPNPILDGLNRAQRIAVTTPAPVVQILAPPGSGKTKTLTARVAHLLAHHGYKPWNVVVATFTVKAAREMKERIGHLIGNGLESKLILGTFHSIARRYLVRYGHLIGIKRSFNIADSADSLAIIKRIIKRRNFKIMPNAARSRISSSKARGIYHDHPSLSAVVNKSVDAQEFVTVYEEYQATLTTSNALDYDDLLLQAISLLRRHPACVSNVEAVLIDEFQDTNVVQFDLMNLFASHRRRVTIVGDPDQSIYSFRSAEIENLDRMRQQYPDTLVVLLEENYRSSGAILLAALAVIQQDKARPDKTLLPTHCVGTIPVLRTLSSAGVEAHWIVSEIKRAMVLTGNTLLSLDDFAILIRSASLSRHVESALGKAGIPYRVRGGHRFYERAEVKIVLDYLRVISSPDCTESLVRIINVPSRRIGPKTIKTLLDEAETRKMTLFDLIREAIQGQTHSGFKPASAAAKGLRAVIDLVSSSRDQLNQTESPSSSLLDLVKALLGRLSFQSFLEQTYPDDHEGRWANIEEVIAQISEFSVGLATDLSDEEALPLIDRVQQQAPNNTTDVLSQFLSNVALATDVRPDVNDDGQAKPQVTISTIHAAKGLEWPVVFVPAAYEGSIPHSRAEDFDEERRLLYVAMTRAKVLLNISTPESSSQMDECLISRFLSCPTLQPHLQNQGPSLSYGEVQSIAGILQRAAPSENDIAETIGDLPSREDDLFPVEGISKDTNHRSRYYDDDDDDGDAVYSAYQDAKRRRLDAISASSTSWSQKRPASFDLPKTTMQQSASFSVNNTSMTSGFVSAGSHLRQMGGPLAKPFQQRSRAPLTISSSDFQPTRGAAPTTSTKDAPTARILQDGQPKIGSFLQRAASDTSGLGQTKSKPLAGGAKTLEFSNGARPTTALSKSASPYGSQPPVNIAPPASSIAGLPPRRPWPSTADGYQGGIPPALALHRPATVPLPTPIDLTRNLPDRQPPNPYIFLSSSPSPPLHPQLQTQNQQAGEAGKENMAKKVGQMPKPTGRKTLGIRRSNVGWSARRGQ